MALPTSGGRKSEVTMTDIVERLETNPMRNLIFREAATEIRTLRARIEVLTDEITWLRKQMNDRALEPKP